MNHPIYVHRYSLQSRGRLNARSTRRNHLGALIRVDGGFACVHPWPELGDLPLEEQLAGVRSGKLTALTRRALFCVQADAEARRIGCHLFADLSVPQSHATLLMDDVMFEDAMKAGFQTVKVKMGRDLEGEVAFVKRMAKRFPDVRWRMDFNGTLRDGELAHVLGMLGDALIRKVDFLEDSGQPIGAAKGSVPIAVDREIEAELEGFDVAVIKPAVNDVPELLRRAQLADIPAVLTSYMDHPLGQSFAAWQAALAMRAFPAQIKTCGLITHGLFEPNPFTEALGTPSPTFSPAPGTGLGFDHLLENLSWTLLRK